MPPKKRGFLREEDLANLDELQSQLELTRTQVNAAAEKEDTLRQQIEEKRVLFESLKDECINIKDATAQNAERYVEEKAENEMVKQQESDHLAMLKEKDAMEAPAEDPFEDFGRDESGMQWVPHIKQMEIDIADMKHAHQLEQEEANLDSIENGGEVVVELQSPEQLAPKLFHIPCFYTFDLLLRDATTFYGVDVNEYIMSTTKGVVWTGKSFVLESIQKYDKEMAAYDDFEPEDLYIQLCQKPPPPPEPQEEVIKPPPKKKPKPPSREELEALARLESRRSRLASTLKCELFFHFIFAISIILAAMFRMPLKDSYDMAQATRAVIEDDFPPELGHNQKSFHDVANAEEMFQFLQHPFMEGMGSAWVFGNNNRVVGGFRILQHRVAPNKCCQIMEQWNKFKDSCYADYASSCASTDAYGPAVVFNNVSTSKWAYLKSPYMLAGTEARFATYDGSGFPLDFEQVWDADASLALKGIKELEAENFVDDQTRAVSVQMTTYNPNYNLFLWIKLVFEFTPGGLVYPQAKYTPLKVILYDTPQDEVRMAFEIISAVFTLIYTIRFFRELCLTKWETGKCSPTFGSFWAWYEILMLAMVWATGGLLVWYVVQVNGLKMKVNTRYFKDMDGPAAGYELAGQCMAIACWLVIIKSFKYMAISQKLSLVNRSLARGAPALATFGVIFMMLYMAFVMMGYQIFGPYVEGYSSIFASITSLFLSSAGVVDYHDLAAGSPIFAPLFFLMFVIVMVFVMLNMFIGIICEAFSVESEATTVTLIEEINSVVEKAKAKFADLTSNAKEEDEMAKIAAEMLG